MRSLRTITLATLAVAGLAMPPAAGAAPVEQNAMIRGAHLSPDTANVDVYLTAFSGGTTTLWLSSVGYGDVSPYNWLAPGVYAVSMRPHGAAASTPAALSWTFTAKAGHAYTAAGVGMNAKLRGIILEDDLNPPPAGHGLVRVIQAASRAPHADVTAGGTALAKDLAFATTTGYASVPAGAVHVTASADGAPVRTSSTVTIGSGSVGSLVVLDGKGSGGIAIRTLVDAAGATTSPIGPVPAGGGGTAPRQGGTDLTWAWGLGAAALAAAGLIAARRRRVGAA